MIFLMNYTPIKKQISANKHFAYVRTLYADYGLTKPKTLRFKACYVR